MLLTMENLVQSVVGMRAQADHPITCLNPEPYFTIKEARIEDGRISVRGENTCWFGQGMVCVFPPVPANA